jgi:hypothetical protein
METLANLTLKLSNELNRIEKRCRSDLAIAESARDGALLATGASSILGRYHKGLDKAKQAQLQTVEKADEARNRDVLAAEDKRRSALVNQERKYRAARTKALGKKLGATRKAKSAWRDAVAKAKREAITRQRTLRKAADESLERALTLARETYTAEVENARLAHRSAVQDDLVNERLAVETAHRQAERIITGAAIDYERAVAQEEARMRVELTEHPEAQREQEAHDRKTSEILAACDEAKEAAFQQFTRERRALNRRRRTKK